MCNMTPHLVTGACGGCRTRATPSDSYIPVDILSGANGITVVRQ